MECVEGHLEIWLCSKEFFDVQNDSISAPGRMMKEYERMEVARHSLGGRKRSLIVEVGSRRKRRW